MDTPPIYVSRHNIVLNLLQTTVIKMLPWIYNFTNYVLELSWNRALLDFRLIMIHIVRVFNIIYGVAGHDLSVDT